jgi:hypothetical protein
MSLLQLIAVKVTIQLYSYDFFFKKLWCISNAWIWYFVLFKIVAHYQQAAKVSEPIGDQVYLSNIVAQLRHGCSYTPAILSDNIVLSLGDNIIKGVCA